jgi:hypothetical protein
MYKVEEITVYSRMALSSNTVRLLRWMYWIVAICAHLYVCYNLFVLDRPITGVVWLILGLLLIFVMYLYYFPLGDNASSWPPYITMCPDYLTAVQTNNTTVCMDYVGLNNPGIRRMNPATPILPSDPSYSQYIFDPSGTTSQKIAAAQSRGLTWEGLF